MCNPNNVDWDLMVQRVHREWAVPCGWWTDLKTDRPLQRDWMEACLLIVTEIAEATEGLRKNLMDDKLPHRPMVEVELADAIIRLCDMAGGFGFQIWLTDVSEYIFPKVYSKTAKLMLMTRSVSSLSVCEEDLRKVFSTQLIQFVFAFCKEYDYDIVGAIQEKHEFNKTRADHKLENRKKENGKQF